MSRQDSPLVSSLSPVTYDALFINFRDRFHHDGEGASFSNVFFSKSEQGLQVAISTPIQFFLAWRIWNIQQSLWVPILISILSLTSFGRFARIVALISNDINKTTSRWWNMGGYHHGNRQGLCENPPHLPCSVPMALFECRSGYSHYMLSFLESGGQFLLFILRVLFLFISKQWKRRSGLPSSDAVISRIVICKRLPVLFRLFTTGLIIMYLLVTIQSGVAMWGPLSGWFRIPHV